jgi:hypothetical protein
MILGVLLVLVTLGEPQVPQTDTIMVTAPGKYLPPRPATSLTEVLPQRVIDGIVGADSIECFLLCPVWEHAEMPQCANKATNWLLGPYGIRKRGGYLTADKKAELLSILMDPGSYLVYQTPGEMKPCVCTRDVAFLFTVVGNLPGRIDRTAVLTCYDCSTLNVMDRNNSIAVDVDYAMDRLLELSKSLFPEDSLLTEIYKRHHSR